MYRSVVTVALAAALAAGLAACHGGSGVVAYLQVRNVSAEAVTVQLDTAGTGPFAGTDRTMLVLDPWREGLCPAARIGVPAGPVSVTVSGGAIPAPASRSWAAAEVPWPGEMDLNVLVDAGGGVTFDGPMPDFPQRCQSPPLRTPAPGG
jgi:hypothetical protein